jgi:hypothetical protein
MIMVESNNPNCRIKPELLSNFIVFSQGALFEKTAPLDPPQKLFIKVRIFRLLSSGMWHGGQVFIFLSYNINEETAFVKRGVDFNAFLFRASTNCLSQGR